MHASKRGLASAVLMVVAVIGAVGCGGGPSGPTVTRSVATRTGSLTGGFGVFESFTTNTSGTVRLTLNWNNAANDLDMAVVPNACPGVESALLGIGSGCAIVANAATLAKPETLSFEASTNVVYKIAIGNLGRTTDTYTLTIDFPLAQ